MRAALVIMFLPWFLSATHAQETTGALPLGMRIGLGYEVPTLRSAPFDAVGAELDDAARDAAGKLPLYARFVASDATLASAGTWTELDGGARLWRLRVISPGAQATELFFEDTHLPSGTQLHVYDDARSQILGGYTSVHVQEDGRLSTGMILGEACIIEYEEPASVRGEGSLHLVRVAHAYRNVVQLKSDACEVDVNCSEGSDWVQQRDAVVRIRVVVPAGAGYCTGTLMNNTANDCKGYILTAFHCTAESVEANYGNYTFRFRYQRPTCGTGSATGNDITGCVRRAGSQDGGDLFPGGQYGSDYSLLEMTSSIPASYSPYWAGWDVTINAPSAGVCIHHPDSDVKKISTYTSQATSTTWAGFTSGSHWQVYWVATTNGAGVTEPGSSGSPLFGPNKRVVGTLTGGASCCTANGCGNLTGPTYPDKFGKMSYHWWEDNPNPTAEELHWWLAPVGNPSFQDGSANPCAPIGFDEMSELMPEVFPNPALDHITLRLPEELQSADQLRITDITGRSVHSETILGRARIEINVRAWSAGTYVVNVLGRNGRRGSTRMTVVH